MRILSIVIIIVCIAISLAVMLMSLCLYLTFSEAKQVTFDLISQPS